jgi:ketosteroid isomerase-like protein
MGGTTSSGSSELDELRDRTIQAYAGGDAERAAGLYVDEGVQQPPGRPAIVGREAIRMSYEMLFGRGGLALRMEAWQTVVSGREARERGAYHLAAGDQTLLAGKYMAVTARSDDGEWRYVWSTVTPD